MSSRNRIRCIVAAVLGAMALLAAGPAEAAGWGVDDLAGLFDRAWQRLAGWLAGTPGSDPAALGGLRRIFENGEDGPHVDPNGGRLTGEPQPGNSQGEEAGLDPAL